jgi:hypothetical protein
MFRVLLSCEEEVGRMNAMVDFRTNENGTIVASS